LLKDNVDSRQSVSHLDSTTLVITYLNRGINSVQIYEGSEINSFRSNNLWYSR
jgi:hypothetical protein